MISFLKKFIKPKLYLLKEDCKILCPDLFEVSYLDTYIICKSPKSEAIFSQFILKLVI